MPPARAPLTLRRTLTGLSVTPTAGPGSSGMAATRSKRAASAGETRASPPPAPPRPGEDEYLSPHHERARSHGVNRFVYWTARAFLQPAFHIYFRLRRTGHRNIPDGAVIGTR